MAPCAFVCQGFAGPGRVGEKPWAGNTQKWLGLRTRALAILFPCSRGPGAVAGMWKAVYMLTGSIHRCFCHPHVTEEGTEAWRVMELRVLGLGVNAGLPKPRA